MDSEYESADKQTQSGYLAMLAIDAQVAFMGSVEKLTDVAVEQCGVAAGQPPQGRNSQSPVVVDIGMCKAMVEKTWRAMLVGVSQLLAQASGEEVALQLLKGYQVFTQACGMLEMWEPRDAFLGNLCEFALASAKDIIAEQESGTRSGAGGPGGLASPRLEDVGLVLGPKNVQAMRTLFNIAHRLSAVLGPAWSLVLETMNTLDKILNSPSTTTKVGAQEPVLRHSLGCPCWLKCLRCAL